MSSALHHMPLMPHLIIEGLNRYDDRPCLFLGETVATYKEVRERTSQYVQALASQGLGVGSRVAVISGNRPEVLYNIAASSISGLCTTALHPLGSLDDHAYMIEDAGIDTLIFDPQGFEQRAKELKERVPGLKRFLAFGPSEVGVDYPKLAETFEPKPLVAAEISPEDLNTIVYTGGTTGRPKGVIQPFRSGAYMTMVQMAEWEFPEEIRFLIATPLSHAAAAVFVPTLQKGGALYVMKGFTPDAFFDMVEQHAITTTFLVPVMIYALLDHPRGKTADLSSLKTLFYGASPMSPARLKEGLERWGQIFFQFFGQSEAPMVISHLKKADHDLSKPERLASCGRPTPWVHVALLDDDNKPVPKGEAGEICVRGPLVMQGYHKLPEATEETLAGGWLHTGDVGRFDEDGFLYIVDRKKDMIVTGGFNVFPREVEDVIATHPAVAQVAVIGVPEEKWGEAVKAVVVLRPGHEPSDALAHELMDLVKVKKGSVQAPKSVDFVDSIPLSALAKPDKKALRARYWGDRTRQVN
ncbi:MAG: AMP-binding protein [Myxococcales bacterium]|nr:AMP-binding protein [Myxococcales bacterium]